MTESKEQAAAELQASIHELGSNLKGASKDVFALGRLYLERARITVAKVALGIVAGIVGLVAFIVFASTATIMLLNGIRDAVAAWTGFAPAGPLAAGATGLLLTGWVLFGAKRSIVKSGARRLRERYPESDPDDALEPNDPSERDDAPPPRLERVS